MPRPLGTNDIRHLGGKFLKKGMTPGEVDEDLEKSTKIPEAIQYFVCRTFRLICGGLIVPNQQNNGMEFWIGLTMPRRLD